jgi:hypothetical protein
MHLKRMISAGLMVPLCSIFVIADAIAAEATGVKRPAIPPDAVRQVTPRPEVYLPDLVVERVYVTKTCRVGFELRNAGRGQIPDSEFDAARATVYFYQIPTRKQVGTKYYPLKGTIDPRGLLKQPGGSVSYTTDIILSAPYQTEVYVDSSHKVNESNENNNRPDFVTLTPDRQRCQGGIIGLDR